MKKTGPFLLLLALLAPLAARAQTELLLSTWEDFRNMDANPAAPFDNYNPRLPSFPTDQWFAPIANGSTPATGSDVDLNQSPIGATNGSNSLKLTQLGTSRGGGDTHYNFATSGYFFFNELVAGSLTFPADPRGIALRNAVLDQATTTGAVTHSFKFDLTLDVEAMTVRDPGTDALTGWFPNPFLGVGLYMGGRGLSGTTNLSSFGYEWITNGAYIDNPTLLDPSDAPGSTPVAPITMTLEVPLPNGVDFRTPLWNILNNTVGSPNGQAIEIGFVINGNWADNTNQSIYIDNLRLVSVNRLQQALDRIDFDNNNLANLLDYQAFLGQFLATAPTLGDFDGDMDVDLFDLDQFERDYNFINGGSALATALAIPEPSSIALFIFGLLGLNFRRLRLASVRLAAAVLAGTAVSATQAQVTLLESWESPGNLGTYTQVSTGAQGSIAISSTPGLATNGSQVLAITQNGDFDINTSDDWIGHAIGQYSTGSPQFDALASAVNLGSNHFRIKLDAIYRTASLPGVDAVFVPLAIGSSGGFNRVGTTIGELQGLWSGGDGNKVVTIDRPLSDFEPLGDVEVNGNSQYQLEIGLGGAQLANGTPGSAFTVYFDNLRLEQISTPDLLKLTVNRQTKNAVLSNPSSNPISLSYYEIRSASGSLNKTNWTSIDDQEPNPDPVGTGFDEVPSSSNSLLAEVR